MPDVVIVGAGLAGLSCAHGLLARGVRALVLDAADEVGGRVRTDRVEGFLLDRGFQVLLTSYPDARRLLDYNRLDLRPFTPGALVRVGDAFERLADPHRDPGAAFRTIGRPPATMLDRLRILRLRRRVLRVWPDDVFQRPERRTGQYLDDEGFSQRFIDLFFRPFLSGVFLESELRTSSRLFEFVFRTFAAGDTVVPAAGMEALPRQLADGLPSDALRLSSRVTEVVPGAVTLADGERLEAGAVVLAVDAPAAARLTALPAALGVQMRGVTCLYYDAPEPPVPDRLLILDGTGRGPITNACVLSNVNPACAPPGRALVSASIPGIPNLTDDAIEQAARLQLKRWFGLPVDTWRLLRLCRVADALPARAGDRLDPVSLPAAQPDGLIYAGDYLDTPSIQGALRSGARAADAALERLAR